MNEPVDQSWHLDKKVPIALISVILGQSLAIVWWASTITGDVRTTADRVTKLERNEDEDRRIMNQMSASLPRIDAQMLELLRSIQRVETWLQRREQSPGQRP
jgi:hypothetical protein